MSIVNAIESSDHSDLATLLREVYRRSMTDPSFREMALNDPKAAIEAVGGKLDGWDIKFVDSENGVDDVFMLPSPVQEAPELTADELDAVAGGAAGCCCGCCDCCDDDPCTVTSEIGTQIAM